ncbi:MAG: hypothetical protein JWO31_2103 [Phycisphaerales bacterium]|nr:hypothetical protein [Phycisphaerales bacterium]
MTSQPPPLSYRGPDTPPPLGRPKLQFAGGLGAGVLASAAAWVIAIAAASSNRNFAVWLAGILVFGKLAVGITYLCRPGRRLVGGGVLTSLALGILVPVGVVAVVLAVVCGGK